MDTNNTMEYRINLEKQNKRNDQVTELILDNCRASQISGLTDDFVNLEMLSMINVGLTTLKGFPRLPKLKKLEISDNRIMCGLSCLHGSPKLQHLNISGNRIKDLEALEPLKEFHDLVNLDLYNCEITKSESYRQKVFELLPNLHTLDGFDRNEREVTDSEESEDEGSDVENRITRDDNDLDDDEEGDESSDYDEETYNAAGGEYEDEEDEDDDDDDDGQAYDDEDDDDDEEDDEEEDIAQDSNGDITGGSMTAAEHSRNGEDSSNVHEIDEDDSGEDEDVEGEDEDDGSDLKHLQKENLEDEDSEDGDFEPSHEVDERDHEIDPEDDADEENAEGDSDIQMLSTSKIESAAEEPTPAEVPVSAEAKTSDEVPAHAEVPMSAEEQTSAETQTPVEVQVPATVTADSNNAPVVEAGDVTEDPSTRGQKRKHEDEGGDEGATEE